MLTKVLLGPWQQHRTHLAVVERGQQLEGFGKDPGLILISRKDSHAVGLKRCAEGSSRGIELERFRAGKRCRLRLRAELAQPLGQACPAARRTDYDREELLVEEQPALAQLLG